MWRLRRFVRRLFNVFRPGGAEPDLTKEVDSHLALLADEFQRRGMTSGEARLAARRAFGGVEQAKERQRDARSFLWLDDARRDVRAAARHREFAVRLAIGAGRARLVRQLLTESLLLAAAGGFLGLMLAHAGSQLLLRLFSAGQFDVVALDVAPNARILAFTMAVACVTAILFGLAPAFRLSALAPGRELTQRTAGQRTSDGRLSASLVVLQVALSLVLLTGAGLFVGTLRNLVTLDTGFRRDGVLVVHLDPRKEGYKETRLKALYLELLARLGRLPGVAAVSLSSNTPLSGGIYSQGARFDGQTPVPGAGTPHTNYVAPGYFEAFQTPMVVGRDFSLRDGGSAPRVAIVNESFVRQYVRDDKALGGFVSLDDAPDELRHMEIVGVVRDAISFSLREPPPPAIYMPFFQHPARAGIATLEVLMNGSVDQVAPLLRADLQSRLPETAVFIQPMTDQIARGLVQERLLATLASVFGCLALGLAGIGLYGLLAYRVTRRTGEIGIRMALGAHGARVVRAILGEALALITGGLLIGVLLAWLSSGSISTLLFGLSPMDPLTVSGTAVLLVMVGVLAAYLPARRAAHLDPMTALRSE